MASCSCQPRTPGRAQAVGELERFRARRRGRGAALRSARRRRRSGCSRRRARLVEKRSTTSDSPSSSTCSSVPELCGTALLRRGRRSCLRRARGDARRRPGRPGSSAGRWSAARRRPRAAPPAPGFRLGQHRGDRPGRRRRCRRRPAAAGRPESSCFLAAQVGDQEVAAFEAVAVLSSLLAIAHHPAGRHQAGERDAARRPRPLEQEGLAQQVGPVPPRPARRRAPSAAGRAARDAAARGRWRRPRRAPSGSGSRA